MGVVKKIKSNNKRCKLFMWDKKFDKATKFKIKDLISYKQVSKKYTCRNCANTKRTTFK